MVIKCGYKDSRDGTATDLLVGYDPTLRVDIGLDPAYRHGQGMLGVPKIKGQLG